MYEGMLAHKLDINTNYKEQSCIFFFLQINGRSHTLVWFEIQVKRTVSSSNTEAQVVIVLNSV
jgi:hypothetical protein